MTSSHLLHVATLIQSLILVPGRRSGSNNRKIASARSHTYIWSYSIDTVALLTKYSLVTEILSFNSILTEAFIPLHTEETQTDFVFRIYIHLYMANTHRPSQQVHNLHMCSYKVR